MCIHIISRHWAIDRKYLVSQVSHLDTIYAKNFKDFNIEISISKWKT